MATQAYLIRLVLYEANNSSFVVRCGKKEFLFCVGIGVCTYIGEGKKINFTPDDLFIFVDFVADEVADRLRGQLGHGRRPNQK